MTNNEKHLTEARESAKAFEDNREPAFLENAYLALENVLLQDEHEADARRRLRADLLDQWLYLLQLLDRFLDPSFDPSDVPQRLVQPPATADGIVYPPGARPALIDDPKARVQYEEAIAANRAKTADYVLQIKLRRLDERITPRAEEFIRNAYTTDPGDQEELSSQIDKVVEDPRRKESLLKLLTPSRP